MPAGRLREPLSSLARASWVVVTKVPSYVHESKLNIFREIIHKYAPQANFTSCRFVAEKLEDYNGKKYDLDHLRNKKVIAFSGLANPKYFYDQLQQLGANVIKTISFADHHWFDNKDLEKIRTELQASRAD